MKKTLLGMVLVLAIGFAVPACKSKPNDAELRNNVTIAISAVGGASADVTEGVVTLSGTVATDAEKAAAEEAAKGIEGVKSVTNNILVVPPIIAEDPALVAGVEAALSAYKTVTADIKEGVVTLRGEIKRADLTKVMQAINALQPKRVDNQMTVN